MMKTLLKITCSAIILTLLIISINSVKSSKDFKELNKTQSVRITLYDNLIDKNICTTSELGKCNSFIKFLDTCENVTTLYNNLLERGLSIADIGTIEEFRKNISPSITISSKSNNKIRTKYFEIDATDEWKYERTPLLEGQLYNGFLYSNNGLIRISAGNNSAMLSSSAYYNRYKDQIINESAKNFQSFKLIRDASSITFLGEEAISFLTEAKHQGRYLQTMSIVFPKGDNMIVVSLSYTDAAYFKTLIQMAESLKFYR